MRSLLKDKLLIILYLFIVLTVSITSGCFANSENNITFYNNYLNKDITFYLPSGLGSDYQYYLIIVSENDETSTLYTAYFSNSPFLYSNDNYIYTSDSSQLYRCSFSSSSDIIDLSDETLSSSGYVLNTKGKIYHSGNGTAYDNYFAYSNHTIYDYNDRENMVFQVAPQVTVTQLSQIVEQAEPNKTLAEVVGILPLILMTIVGLIGLRKALRFLQKLLSQS